MSANVPVQFQTEKRRILSSRRRLLAIHEEAAKAADAAVERLASSSPDSPEVGKARENAAAEHLMCEQYRALIAARESDDRYLITVRRIGASDDGKSFDPSLAPQLAAQERTAVFEARRRARDWLTERKMNIEPDNERTGQIGSVTARVLDDPQWVKDSHDVLKANFVAGIVGGESEWLRIYNLGFGEGGADLGSIFLRQAVEEVVEFNTVSAEKKSA